MHGKNEGYGIKGKMKGIKKYINKGNEEKERKKQVKE